MIRSTRTNGSLELRTLNREGALSSAAHTQFAKCDLCAHDLEISVGTIASVINGQRFERSGVLVERCTNRRCVNATPHQHVPTREQPNERLPGEIGPTPPGAHVRAPRAGDWWPETGEPVMRQVSWRDRFLCFVLGHRLSRHHGYVSYRMGLCMRCGKITRPKEDRV